VDRHAGRLLGVLHLDSFAVSVLTNDELRDEGGLG